MDAELQGQPAVEWAGAAIGRYRNVRTTILWVLAVAVVLCGLMDCANAGEHRLGLVITNKDYTHQVPPLENAHKDGNAMAAALSEVGFEIPEDTRRLYDVTRQQMEAAIDGFRQDLQRARQEHPADRIVGFFYYSGHGGSDDDQRSYLIPVGTTMRDSQDLTSGAVPIQTIVNGLGSSGATVFIVLDACRNVLPQTRFKGLRAVPKSELGGTGIFIAYATQPGAVAQDNHAYASALAQRIRQPSAERDSAHYTVVFSDAHGRVKRETGQNPYYGLDSFDPVYFNFKPATDAPVPRKQQEVEPVDSLKWTTLQTWENAGLYFPREAAHFKDNPNGAHLGFLPAGTTLFNRRVEIGEIGNQQWFRFKNLHNEDACTRFENAIVY